MHELRPGLWRWTARHPDWEPDAEPESPADWPPDVGCVAYAADDVLVLIDPLVVDGWNELDRLAERHARVAVLKTLRFHDCSVGDAVARYSADTEPPAGVEPIEITDETLVDLPIELLLVSHGEPILSDGRKALDRALEA